MNNEMTIGTNMTTGYTNITADCTERTLMSKTVKAVRMPIEKLQKYYSNVLGEKLTLRQTLCLINAQAAFFMTVLPGECPLLLRSVFLVWLLDALLRCKRSGIRTSC